MKRLKGDGCGRISIKLVSQQPEQDQIDHHQKDGKSARIIIIRELTSVPPPAPAWVITSIAGFANVIIGNTESNIVPASNIDPAFKHFFAFNISPSPTWKG